MRRYGKVSTEGRKDLGDFKAEQMTQTLNSEVCNYLVNLRKFLNHSELWFSHHMYGQWKEFLLTIRYESKELQS